MPVNNDRPSGITSTSVTETSAVHVARSKISDTAIVVPRTELT